MVETTYKTRALLVAWYCDYLLAVCQIGKRPQQNTRRCWMGL